MKISTYAIAQTNVTSIIHMHCNSGTARTRTFRLDSQEPSEGKLLIDAYFVSLCDWNVNISGVEANINRLVTGTVTNERLN